MKKRVTAILSRLLFVLSLTGSLNLFGQAAPVEIGLGLKPPFRFVAYGDARFTDPNNKDASNAAIREELVKAIAEAHPTFITIGGDLVYNGFDTNDWKEWDSETAEWRDQKIPVYPVLGNHEMHGNVEQALANYFARFPDLQHSRYYSVRTANALFLMLDSNEPELSGKQGKWLTQKLDTIPPEIDYLFVVLHHPPFTNSSDLANLHGGGHSARSPEKKLARLLENRQPQMHARIIVFGSHVHNYERHEHGGITYFVTGGGGAHPYMIPRAPDDPLRGYDVNYHYLLVEVNKDSVKITMNRVELVDGKAKWNQPDEVTIQAAK